MVRYAITIDVEVDIVAWGDEYGMRGPVDIKADVLGYASSAIDNSAAGQMDLIKVTAIKISERRS